MTNDLISREALIKAFEDCTGDCACCVHNTNDFKYCGLIDDAQAVPLPNEQIAWEQGYEAGLAQGKHGRPQGEWIPQGGGFSWVFKCSCCGWVDGYPFNKRHKYCPNCGADMREAVLEE